MPYAAVARGRVSRARPTVAMSAPAQDFVASSVNFDGHFVMSESRSPTKPAPCLRTVTMTSRPSRNGSGTAPLYVTGTDAVPLRSRTRKSTPLDVLRTESSTTLPVSWYATPILAVCARLLGETASLDALKLVTTSAVARTTAADSATTSLILRLRAGGMDGSVSQSRKSPAQTETFARFGRWCR